MLKPARPPCVKVGCISGSDGNRHLPEGLLASGLTGCLGPILSLSLAAGLSPACSTCSCWSFICVSPLAFECFHTACCSWFGWKEQLLGLSGERGWAGQQECTHGTFPSSSLPVKWRHPRKAHLTDNMYGLRDLFPVSCLCLTAV